MDTISLEAAQRRSPELVDDVAARGTVYLIRREDAPSAVLMSVEEYESFHETPAVLSDRATMDRLRISMAELVRGEMVSFDDTFPAGS